MIIPFRATILSSLLAVPSLFISFLSKRLTNTIETQGYIVNISVILVASIKVPTVIAFGFKSNNVNENVDKETRREQRRQKELEFALETRKQRKGIGCHNPDPATTETTANEKENPIQIEGVLPNAIIDDIVEASKVVTVAEIH